ncbi:MAG TPA: DNA cytosine methyltransferase [Phycisphaerae bacterium]|nr:DNA cytosine methyltransferase [Phycisphaerae bacterium]
MDRKKGRFTAVDLFCGVGGMSLGFEQAGFKILAGFDSNPINVTSYAHNFPKGHAFEADLSRITGPEIRRLVGLKKKDRIDVLFGGPPCQGISVIGKREIADRRNGLLFHFARLVRQLQPRYFVVENVGGLVLGEARSLLESFVRRAKLAGYHVQDVDVLCASDFGVPQRRERVFIFGCLKRLDLPAYPSPCNPASAVWGTRKPTVWSAIGDIPDVDRFEYLLEKDELIDPLGQPRAYAAVLRGNVDDPKDHAPARRFSSRKLGGCLRTIHSKETVKRFAYTEPGTSEPTSRYFRLEKTGKANTLRAGTGPDYGSYTAARPIHPVHPRCITVREAARLHSFPDWFSFHPTKWHGFQQVGNSVPPLFARAVAREIVAVLRAGNTA